MNSSVTSMSSDLQQPDQSYQLSGPATSNQTQPDSPFASLRHNKMLSGEHHTTMQVVPYYYATGNNQPSSSYHPPAVNNTHAHYDSNPQPQVPEAESQRLHHVPAPPLTTPAVHKLDRWSAESSAGNGYPAARLQQIPLRSMVEGHTANYLAVPSDQLLHQQQLTEAANQFNSVPNPDEDAALKIDETSADGQQATEGEENGSPDEPQAQASDELDADDEGAEQESSEADTEAGPEPGGEDADQNADGLGAGLEPVNGELVEHAGKRSFSEDELDANEYDKDGVLISEHHKHLLNGKPVRGRRDQQRAAEQRAKAIEFDKIVDEIEGGGDGDGDGESDSENEHVEEPELETEQEHQASERAGQLNVLEKRLNSRAANVRGESPTVKLAGSRGSVASGSAPTPVSVRHPSRRETSAKKPIDSHRHQLYELLSAQQWDDDVDGDAPEVKRLGPAAKADAETLIDFEGLNLLKTRRPTNGSHGQAAHRRRRRQVSSNLLGSALEVPANRSSALNASSDTITVSLGNKSSTDNLAVPFGLLSGSTDRSNNENISHAKSSHLESPNYLASSSNNGPSFSTIGAPNESVDRSRSVFHANQVGHINQRHPPPLPDPVNGQEDLNVEVMSHPPNENVKPADVYATIQVPAANPPMLQSSYQPHVRGHTEGLTGHAFYGPTTTGSGSPPTRAQGHASLMKQNAKEGSLSVYSPRSPLASGSKAVKKKKKMQKSKMYESKYDAAKAQAMKKKSKSKKGSMRKKKAKAKKRVAHKYKVFHGATRGKKGAKGKANKGAKKGALYYKDKGYKKRGFKRAYQKVEAGDHKTYFDEYRDKDHSKRWKNFKDGHHFSQNKHWAGKDKRLHKDHKFGTMKQRHLNSGAWKEKKASKYRKDYKHKSKKGKKSASKRHKSN